MTKTQIKKSFNLFYDIDKQLDNIIIRTSIKGKDVTLRVSNVAYCYYDGEFVCDDDDYDINAHCGFSTWLEDIADIYWGDLVDINVLKEANKLVGDKAKEFEKTLPKDVDREIFNNAYWSCLDINETKTSCFNDFYEQYNDILTQHLERLAKEKNKEAVKESPEEYISVNGVLLSKKEIKELAAKL